MKSLISALLAVCTLVACESKQAGFDASGVFEAEEVVVSAEAGGIIKALNVEEGQVLAAGQYLGYIDSTQAFLKKQQLQAQIGAVRSRRPNTGMQLAALQAQLQTAEHERDRVARLVKLDAATPKQLDDANAQVKILQREIAAQRSTLDISTGAIEHEATPLQVQVEQQQDQLSKFRIINPVAGTVLTTYAEAGELTISGKALYRIADLTTVWLRAYLSTSQLAGLKLGQRVTVLADDGKGKYRSYPGTLAWISDKAEFTPKTIQTKEERANTVYAAKVKVPNDGRLKIGMYADLKFQ